MVSVELPGITTASTESRRLPGDKQSPREGRSPKRLASTESRRLPGDKLGVMHQDQFTDPLQRSPGDCREINIAHPVFTTKQCGFNGVPAIAGR